MVRTSDVGASQAQVLHAAMGVLRVQAEPTPINHDALADAAAAQADADRLAAERAHRAEHSAALAELNIKLKAQNQLARDACGAKHAALEAKNKRALCGQLAAGLLYAAVDAARVAAADAHRIHKPTKFTLNPADPLLPTQYKEPVQLLVRLEFLTDVGTVTPQLSDAKRMALCLVGIPPELMTRLLETGINASLAAFRRFVKEAIEQKRSKEDIAAAIALALDKDSAKPLTFERVMEAAPREPRTRASAQPGEASALVSRQPAGRPASGPSRRRRARAAGGGDGARKRPKGCAEVSAHVVFTLEDAQRVQAAAERLQAMAEHMRQQLEAGAMAQAAQRRSDADDDAVNALELAGVIEHLREVCSIRRIGLVAAPLAAPTHATSALGYELITHHVAPLPHARATQLGLGAVLAEASKPPAAAAAAEAEADGHPSVGDAA